MLSGKFQNEYAISNNNLKFWSFSCPGDEKKLKSLIENGADIRNTALDSEGRYAIHIAAQRGNSKPMEFTFFFIKYTSNSLKIDMK